jgi:adenylate cyclase
MVRKLAAILAADIVGYSSMMGKDEAGTLDAISQFQTNTFRPEVVGNRGKIVKSMGDGWLVEFASVVDAINCSMKVQDKLKNLYTLKLRIGVHVGDIIFQDDDIFGDGVNVAARLEALAKPGGIAISDITYSSLDGTLTPSFDDAGEQQLKNIARAIRIWIRGDSITYTSGQTPKFDNNSGDRLGFPKLAIFPIKAPTDRPEVQELAEALVFDLGAHLSAIRWLDVGSGNSIKEPAYTLQGSLRNSGDKLRLEMQVLGPGEQILWQYKKDGYLSNSFDFQDDASEETSAKLIGALLEAEIAKLSGRDIEILTAEQCLLRGMMAYRSVSAGSFSACLGYYAAAIEKNPNLAEAYAEGIFMTVGGGATGFKSQLKPYFDLLPKWIENAEPLRLSDPLLDLSVAVATYMKDNQIAPVLNKVEDCLRRAPFDVQVLVFAGWGLLWGGRCTEALDCFIKVERLGKFSPYLISALGGASTAYVQVGDDDAAISYARKGLLTAHEYPTLFASLAAACAFKGMEQEAAEAMINYQKLVPGQTIAQRMAVNSYAGSPGGIRFYEGLRLAGMPE